MIKPNQIMKALQSFMSKLCPSVFLLLMISYIAPAQEIIKTDNWHGFERSHFVFKSGVDVKDRAAWIVKPVHAQKGNPWIWNAHFPDWHTDIDSVLLSRGFHVVYLNTNDMYGSPHAMQIWDDFFAFMVQKGFSSKVALEGVSRGGLYVYNWAKRNPLNVSCIYAEAPVCDFKSWPGGKGVGKGSPESWTGLLKSYGFTEEQAMAYKNNPIDNLEGLAACRVPVLHAIGLNDQIVPNAENTYLLVNNYIRLGGIATVYPMTRGEQKLEGHHFSIERPEQIADFIFENSYPVKKMLDPAAYHTPRSNLNNSFLKFTRDKKGRVAFMGGSITEHGAWRNKVCNYLKEKFPGTSFEFINAGISSTGSTPGAFRLEKEVLSAGPIDLFFEEAAVNDRTNGFDNNSQIRGMEGIVRHALLSNPYMDIVLMHFVDPAKMEDYNKGIIPTEIVNHEKVAAHYKVNTINLAKEVTDRINAGEFDWRNDFIDLHPSLFGHEVYAASIKAFLNEAYSGGVNVLPAAHSIPSKLDKFSYASGYYMPVDKAKMIKGWTLDNNWMPNDGVGTRKQYVDLPALIAVHPGAEMKLAFEGTAIGICIASGPDAGIIEYSVDGKPFKKRDLMTQWSGMLHLPWYLMLEEELTSNKHELVIRITPEANEKSKGHACRILHFLVNR
jgi:sialidase-1